MPTPEQWLIFLELPIVTMEDYGLSHRVVAILESSYQALYIKDLQQVTETDCLHIRQLSLVSVRELQMALSRTLKAVETGELLLED